MQKHSHKRDAILEVLRSTKSHPSAEWLYSEVKKTIPDLSLATVYRNIAVFRKNDLIMSVSTVNGQERFYGNTKPHPHFICTSCDSVMDIDLISFSIDTSEIEKKYDFVVDSHFILFYGICGKCKD